MVKVRLQSQRPSVAGELIPPSRFWSLSYTKSLYKPQGSASYTAMVSRSTCACAQMVLTVPPVPFRILHYSLEPWKPFEDVRHEGIRTLWNSLPATLVMTVPATTIYFTAYNQLRAFLCGQSWSSDLYTPLDAGALAHMGTVTVINPLELVWTKPQAQHVSYCKWLSVLKLQ